MSIARPNRRRPARPLPPPRCLPGRATRPAQVRLCARTGRVHRGHVDLGVLVVACVGPIPDGPEGCYDTSEHKCDCDTSKADCKLPGHVWTEGCASCSSSSARTPAVGLAAIR